MGSALRKNSPLRADMSNILVQEPMIAATALFMEHVDNPQTGTGDIAMTDGRRVTVWPDFHALRGNERAGVLLHEYLHVAFAHPLRGMRLKLRLGVAYRHDIFNVAADAIINEGIRKGSKRSIDLPKGGVDLQELAEQAKAIVELTGVKVDHARMRQVGRITLEWMYDALVRLEEAAQAGCSQGEREREDGGDNGVGSPLAGNDNQKATANERLVKKAKEFLEQFERPQDIDLASLMGMTHDQLGDAIRAAGEQLKNSIAMAKQHGNGKAGLIELLGHDIPKVDTPWESSFRSVTQKHLMRQRVRSPSKPSRRVLTQEALKASRIIWSAGRKRPHVPRVVVVLDSSGSIRLDEYMRYLSEIQAMKRRTNAQIFVIVADMEVQSVQEIKDVKDIREVEFKGRGGTDFRPAFEMIDEMNVDLAVYLTDLMGTFPERKPDYPVLWTLPGMEIPNGYDPPFGRVLMLD